MTNEEKGPTPEMPPRNPKSYPIPEELMERVLNYLAQQPYVSVAKLIGDLARLVEAKKNIDK